MDFWFLPRRKTGTPRFFPKKKTFFFFRSGPFLICLLLFVWAARTQIYKSALRISDAGRYPSIARWDLRL